MKTTMNVFVRVSTALSILLVAACGRSNSVEDNSQSEADLQSAAGFTQTGMSSYYGVGDGFHGRRTANGETFNAHGLTAAHRTLRFGTCLNVTNLNNNKSVRVRVNDRGPYSGNRILDLSYGAAKAIGMVSSGVARVRVESVSCSSATSSAALAAPQTPVDKHACKVYLTVNSRTADSLNITAQSRPASGDERPCGKTLRVVGAGSVSQSKLISELHVGAGSGRISAKIPLSALDGVSHIHAEAIDSEGVNRGQSDAKIFNAQASL